MDMNKMITNENVSGNLNERPMMMCCIAICCLLGMGGLPM